MGTSSIEKEDPNLILHPGTIECKSCPAGEHQKDTGASSCDACEIGTNDSLYFLTTLCSTPIIITLDEVYFSV